MRESDTYQAILEEGMAEGRVMEARAFLLRLGRKRFGPPDAKAQAALESVADLSRLEAMADRLDEVSDWEQLLRSEN